MALVNVVEGSRSGSVTNTMDMSFEQLFGTSTLNVVVPDTSVEYPPQSTSDDWLTRLQSSSVERKQAFFGG